MIPYQLQHSMRSNSCLAANLTIGAEDENVPDIMPTADPKWRMCVCIYNNYNCDYN